MLNSEVFDAKHKLALEILNDPQPGDWLSEFMSFHCFVVSVDGDLLVTLE